MKEVAYPLGYSPLELTRLDQQALLIHDLLLDNLAANAKSCLEIGCGPGSNLPLLRRVNPCIRYTGIDISVDVIATAKNRFHEDINANFFVSDALAIHCNEKFDLIFVKLVLWSIGPMWRNLFREVRKLLHPGGIFYVLEPCNRWIQFYPPKPAMNAWMQKWDESAEKQGLHPNIGIEVAHEMLAAGFNHVESKFFPVMSFGWNQERYHAIINNLQGFYMGKAAQQFELEQEYAQEKEQAMLELKKTERHSFVMDALFVSWSNG